MNFQTETQPEGGERGETPSPNREGSGTDEKRIEEEQWPGDLSDELEAIGDRARDMRAAAQRVIDLVDACAGHPPMIGDPDDGGLSYADHRLKIETADTNFDFDANDFRTSVIDHLDHENEEQD